MSASESDFATATDIDARRAAAKPGESEKEVLQRLRELNLHKGWLEVEGTDSEATTAKDTKSSTSTPWHVNPTSSSPMFGPVDPTLNAMLRKAIDRQKEIQKMEDEKTAKESDPLNPQSEVQMEEDEKESEIKDWEPDFDDDDATHFEDGPIVEKETLNPGVASSSSTLRTTKMPQKRTKPDAVQKMGRSDLLKNADGETSDQDMGPPKALGPIKPLNASSKKRASSRQPVKIQKGDTGESTQWLGMHSKTEFLNAVSNAFLVDSGSAEGFNTHLALYYYASEDWNIPHPSQLKTCVLFRDSTRYKRWCCWLCPTSTQGRKDHLSFKTSAEQEVHWWGTHASQPCWDFCRKAQELNITTSELSGALLGLDIKMVPIPAGASLKMLPDSLPSHPKGHNAKVFKDPWYKRVTPSTHDSERDLPWRFAEQKALAVPVKAAPTPPPYPPTKVDCTMWGWPVFWDSMVKDNSDVVRLLIHPSATMKAYVAERQAWHSTHSTLASKPFTDAMIEVEQHALLILLLKLVLTKAAAKQIASEQEVHAKKLKGLG